MTIFSAKFLTKKATFTVLATATALTAFSPAHAQLSNQSTIANPARVGEQLGEDLFVPQIGPKVDVKQMKLQGAPAGAEKIKFKFGGLRVEGNTVYDQKEVSSVYADKIGQTVSLADVYDMANQMTLKYRNDGYVLTQVVVPPQTIDGGIPRLKVVEGFIEKVIVQAGDKEGPEAVKTIKAYAGKIANSGPTNIKELERQLLIINDLPGVEARSILSPSKTTAGAADLLVIVERKPYDAMISVDNFGSRYLGPHQLSAAGTLNSVAGFNDALTAQFVITPEFDEGNELVHGSLGYSIPVGYWGTKFSVLASMTDTDPGYDLEQFEVHGRSDLLSLQVSHPFIRSRATNLHGRMTFDMRNVQSENNVAPERNDHVRALRAGLRYEFLDQLLGTVSYNVADIEISRGVPMFGASDKDDANLTRANGDPHFTKAELELQRLHRLSTNFNLLLEGHAQVASDALLSSEEFGVGGINSGRGYDPSEIVGDHGISGRIEVQWKNPGNLQSTYGQYLEKYQLYGFWDGGRVWNIDAVTADDKVDSITSVGTGVRANFVSGISGGLAVAFPTNRDIQTRDDKGPKVYFNLSKTF